MADGMVVQLRDQFPGRAHINEFRFSTEDAPQRFLIGLFYSFHIIHQFLSYLVALPRRRGAGEGQPTYTWAGLLFHCATFLAFRHRFRYLKKTIWNMHGAQQAISLFILAQHYKVPIFY